MRELTLSEIQQLAGGSWQTELIKFGISATTTLVGLFGQYMLYQQNPTLPEVYNLNGISMPVFIGAITYVGIQVATWQCELQLELQLAPEGIAV